ncbi:MAG: DMT family transporter [Anaerotignum sp.]
MVRIKDYRYALLAALNFAVITVLSKFIMGTELGAITLIFFQCLFVTIGLLIYISVTDIKQLKLSKEKLKLLLIQGALGSSGGMIFYYLALEYMDANLTSALFFCSPAVVYGYEIMTKRKKASFLGMSSLAISIIGILMVINIFHFNASENLKLGILFAIIACFANAFYNVFIELKLNDIKAVTYNFYTVLVVLFISIIVLKLTHQTISLSYLNSWKLTMNVLILSVCGSIIPTICVFKSVSLIGAQKTVILSTMELPITIVLSYIFLGEVMSLIQIIGCVAIIYAIIRITKSE